MGFQIYWLTQKQNNNNDGNNCYALFYLVAKLHFFFLHFWTEVLLVEFYDSFILDFLGKSNVLD